MKNSILFALLLICCQFGLGQSETSSSPYFLVQTKEKGTDLLPLKSTTANVNISGVIADVVVDQTYTNEGKQPIEAIYVFPGSTNAAVYGLQMKIGQRTITANIEEKNKARETYTTAKNEGKRASLLEQHRPNVFQMNVANIMPGDTIVVSLRYTELLVPQEGTYSFVYPTVVGPRYINGQEQSNTSFAAMPYQHEGKSPKYDFDLSVHLSTGIPVQNITSPSHKITIQKSDPSVADIELKDSGEEGNRDFVLQYNLKGKKIDAGMLVYDEGDEKFFLCMVQPPKQVEIENIPPREFIFIVDVSGSMMGFPVEVAKKLMTDLLIGLRPYDRFNILLFAGGSELLAPNSLLANTENIARAMTFLYSQNGGGGTELLNALQTGLDLPRDIEGLSRSIVVITDGYVGVEPEAFELIRTNLNNANLYAFGIGSSVNRFLIEGLAKVGQGVPEIVLDQEQAPAAAERFRKYIESPLLTQVTLQLNGFEAYDIEPISIPDVLSDRPIIVFGKFRGQASGTIAISGYQGTNNQSASLDPSDQNILNCGTERSELITLRMDVSHSSSSKFHSALKYLWARERIKRLSDFGDYNPSQDKIDEITSLGLTYNLLTAYTSFVAVDDAPVNDEASSQRTIHQPLPMPEGVSDSAIGFSMGIIGMSGTPASSFGFSIFLAITVLCLFGLFFWKARRWMHGSFILILVAGCCMNCSVKQDSLQSLDNRCAQASKITFILGEDDSDANPYYSQAAAFYHQADQDGTYVVLDKIRSLQHLHEYLSMNIPPQGAWKEINLVIHGNQWTGMALAISEHGEARTTAKNLMQAMWQQEFIALPDAVVNDHTHVNIYGCSVGLDTALVSQLSKFFTNQSGVAPSLTASQHFNIYHSSFDTPGKTERLEANCFYIAYPLEHTPTTGELAKALTNKYPAENISLQLHWAVGLNPALDSYAHQFYIPIQWTFLYENENERPSFLWQDDLRRWIKNQSELNSTLSEMQFKPEDFWWTANATDQKVSLLQSLPAIHLRGGTRIYCVLVPILDKSEGC